jgi:uncharacterized repeat protein (TIGR01451 family)
LILCIFITVLIQTVGLHTNFAEAAYNNSAGIIQAPVNDMVSTLVGDPMMEIIKTAPISANVNENIMYTIYYWNNGTANAYNVVITEYYDSVTFVDANPAPTTPDNIWVFAMITWPLPCKDYIHRSGKRQNFC